MTFQKFFREELSSLQDKIKEKGVLSRKGLSKIITEFSTKQKTPISQNQVDILIKVLDSNSMCMDLIDLLENNKIDQHEFIGVLQNRVFYGASEVTTLSLSNFRLLINSAGICSKRPWIDGMIKPKESLKLLKSNFKLLIAYN